MQFSDPVKQEVKLLIDFQADDSMVCAGMADGLVQFLHRKVPPSESEREAEEFKKKASTMQHRYLQVRAAGPPQSFEKWLIGNGMILKTCRM